jgi:hypothetical protein
VKSKLSFMCVLFCLVITITGAQVGMAQLLELQEPQWLTEMYQQGWQKVQEGVLQRSAGGQIETFTYGEEGLQWTVESLKRQVIALQQVYDQKPSPELAESLASLRNQLGVATTQLSNGQVEAPSSAQMENCDFSMGAHVFVDSLKANLSPGVTASADAYFHSSGCGFYGNTYANVTVEGNNGTVFTYKNQEDPKFGGSWLDSAVSLSLGVSTACKSTAYARAWSDSPSFGYEAQRIENYSCPVDTPFTVSISGPGSVYTDTYTPCQYATWTANPSGGTPGYTYYWYINGVYQASGNQLTLQYCYTNATLNVSVQASDSSSPQKSASASFTTYVSYYEDYCTSNPYTCECDPYRCGGCYQYPYANSTQAIRPPYECPYY